MNAEQTPLKNDTSIVSTVNAETPLIEKEQQKKSNSTTTSKYVRRKKLSKLGPFILLQTIGVGEFGKVKLGRHEETSQIVTSPIFFLTKEQKW